MFVIDESNTTVVEVRIQRIESEIVDISTQMTRIEEKQNNLLNTLEDEKVTKRSLRNQIIAGIVAVLITILGGTWKLSDTIARNAERTVAETSARIAGDAAIKERINFLTMKGPNYRGIRTDATRITDNLDEKTF